MADNVTHHTSSQKTQCICRTFVQCWTNVENVWPTLYKYCTNVLCQLGYWSYLIKNISQPVSHPELQLRAYFWQQLLALLAQTETPVSERSPYVVLMLRRRRRRRANNKTTLNLPRASVLGGCYAACNHMRPDTCYIFNWTLVITIKLRLRYIYALIKVIIRSWHALLYK